MRGWVRLGNTNLSFSLQIPDFHLTIQIAKASKAQEPTQIAPNNFVPVANTKLKYLLIMLTEHDWVRWHEATDNNKILTFMVPTEIMDRTLESLNFIDFAVFVVENIQTILTVVGFTGGIVVGLELHEELVGLGAETKLDLLCFLDCFFVEGLWRLMGKKSHQSRVALLVEKQRGQ